MLTIGERGATPSTPATGFASIYVKDDGVFYTLDDEGNEVALVPSSVSSATTEAEGIVELATQAEMDAGTAGKVPTTDLNKVTLGTPQSATGSETAFNFTVPAGTREVSILPVGLSLSGTDDILIQIGPSAGVETTSYVSTSAAVIAAPGVGISTSTAGFVVRAADAAGVCSGKITLSLANSATNTWVSSHSVKRSTTSTSHGGGDKAIAGALVHVRITRTGTDTFDAGSVNVASQR